MKTSPLPESEFTISLPKQFGRLLVCYRNGKVTGVRLLGEAVGGRGVWGLGSGVRGLDDTLASPETRSPIPETRDPRLERSLRADFIAYFSGRKVEFSYPVDLEEFTPFQKAVWSAMRKIPYGQTRTYRWLAEKVGKPRAYRAVGNACGKNPLLIIQPCHRVVGSHGKLGGFSAGLNVKKALLRLEGVNFDG